MRSIKAFVLSLTLAFASVHTLTAGMAVRLFYPGFTGNSVAEFKASPGFPYNFDQSPYYSQGGEDPSFTFMTNGLTTESRDQNTFASDFGSLIRGYIEAPVTGGYVFWLASDDDSEFWLSTDATRAGLRTSPICLNIGAVGFQVWTSKAQQRSQLIQLVKGQKYYYEVYQKQGGGAQHVSVGWQLPDGTLDRPISAKYLNPIEETFVTGNTPFIQTNVVYAAQAVNAGRIFNVSAVEHSDAVFYVTVIGKQPVGYRWQRNNIDIPGETLSSITLKNVSLTNNSAVFRCIITNATTTLTTSGGILTVTTDTTRPTLLSATTFGHTNIVTLRFSEPVDNTALNTANYIFTSTNGNTPVVASAVSFIGTDNTRVNVTVTPAFDLVNAFYFVQATNVQDLATTPNKVTTNQVAVFGFVPWDGAISFARFTGIGGNTDVGSLTNNANFVAWKAGTRNPDVSGTYTNFHTGVNIADNYGEIVYGYVIPPVSGGWSFYLLSDDNSGLYLSTDANPANKVQIAQVPTWGNNRQWVADLGGGNSTAPINGFNNYSNAGAGGRTYWSKPINLQAGLPYYIEAVMKEGGGGDFVGVTWKAPDGVQFNGNDIVNTIPIPANNGPEILGRLSSGFSFLSTTNLPNGADVNIINAALPADATVADFKPASFTVVAGGSPTVGYQWYKSNNVSATFLPVADGGNATLTIPFVTLPDSNSFYYCVVTNGFSVITSRTARLTVIADTVPPVLVGAQQYNGTFTNLKVFFSEAMDLISMANKSNYTILNPGNNPLTIANVLPDLRNLTNVIIELASNSLPILPGQVYTVTVTNILDGSSSSNQIVGAPSTTFTGWVLSRGFIEREVYLNVGGGLTDNLRLNGVYPDFRDDHDYIGTTLVGGLTGFGTIQTPNGQGVLSTGNIENFGERFMGILTSPATSPSGLYYFYLQGDDGSAFFISPDATLNTMIANSADTIPIVEFQGANTPTLSPQYLMGTGVSHFFIGLHKEGGGGDYMRLAWRDQADGNSIDGTNDTFVIPPTYFAAYANPVGAGVVVSNVAPTNAVGVPELTRTNFTVVTIFRTNLNNANPPVSYVWQTAPNGSSTFVDVEGQSNNTPTLVTLPLTFADNLRQWRCIVSVPGASVTSRVATATVIANTNPLVIVRVSGGGTGSTVGIGGTNIMVSFDRLVDANSIATAGFTIALTNGTGTLTNFTTKVINGTNVLITTSAQVEFSKYKLTVNPSVTDISVSHNTVSPTNNSYIFTSWTVIPGRIQRYRFDNIGGTAVANLTAAPAFPNSPTLQFFDPNFESAANQADNFGYWEWGWFVPPTNGYYVFAISSDDNSELWLSTDDKPANKVRIAIENVWHNLRSFGGGGNAAPPSTGGGGRLIVPSADTNFYPHLNNQSDAIFLNGGQRYYIEALQKEGGGGDDLAVAVDNNTNTFLTFIATNASPALYTNLITLPNGNNQTNSYVGLTNNPNGTLAAGSPIGIRGGMMVLWVDPDKSVITANTLPTSQTVVENHPVSFSVGAVGSSYYSFPATTETLLYQWFTNGVAVTNGSIATGDNFAIVSGATTATLTFSQPIKDFNGMVVQVRVAMTNAIAVTNFFPVGSNVTLTVNADVTPPRLLDFQQTFGGAWGGTNTLGTTVTNFDTFVLRFDEVLNTNVAQNPANYYISSSAGDLTVLSATLVNGGTNVILKTATQPVPGTNYTLTVSNLTDVALAGGNTIVTTQKNVASWVLVNGWLRSERYEGISGGAISSLTNNVKYKLGIADSNATTATVYYTNKAYMVQTAPQNVDNFGARLIGFFIPPTNGFYTFYNRGDDGSAIYVTTNGVRTLASGRDNTANQSAASSNPTNNAPATPIVTFNMVAGQYYPIEMLLKEGGGGDVFEGYVASGTDTNNPVFFTTTGPGTVMQPGSLFASYADPSVAAINITAQPTNRSVALGSTTTFVVTATTSGPLVTAGAATTYQWYTNGVAIPGATSSSYTTPAVTANDNGTVYTVRISIPEKSLLSAPATLSTGNLPQITSQPAPSSVTTNVGAQVTFTAAATGATSYQWYFNATNLLAGQTATSMTLNNVQYTNVGSYLVRVANAFGTVTSSPATLSVLVTPYQVSSMSKGASAFTASFLSDAGRTYKVEFASALGTTNATVWTLLTNIVGNGSAVTINDTSAPSTNRYYRISTPYP